MIALLLQLALTPPDAGHLARAAAAAGVPPALVLDVAAAESGLNLDPHLRGHACWNRRVRKRDCEVGRFQIKPSTARRRCPGENVFTYAGNVRCFLRMFGADLRAGGVRYALWRQNASAAYAAVVLGPDSPLCQEVR